MPINRIDNQLKIIGAVIGGIALLVVGSQSFEIVEPGQVAVRQRLGQLDESGVLREGLHFKMPFVTTLKRYNAQIQEPIYNVQASTKDLQEIEGELKVFYRVDPEVLQYTIRTVGDLTSIERKVESTAQEAFKSVTALSTAEESVTKRVQLRNNFDELMKAQLSQFGVVYDGSAIVDLDFSPKFKEAVEAKQIAQQRADQAVFEAQQAENEAQRDINRAKGRAEAQRLLAETLNAAGGELVLYKEAIEAWSNGAQVPTVLVVGEGGGLPFILNGLPGADLGTEVGNGVVEEDTEGDAPVVDE